MTDLVFEFTSTAPEMEKAASAALKRLQESALKTATILSGAGKSSAKDLRKMVDEMEGAAGGSVEALSNMASRMEQRANSFRKNATDLKNTALGQAKALRDAAKQLQDAAAQIGAVNLPRKGASAASIKAFTDQFTSAAKQFESAVADVGSATANYIKFDKQFEDRLNKKSTQANTAASQAAASNELISIQKAQGEALAQASKRQKEAIEADLAGFRNMERLRLQAQNSSQNALAKAQGEALAQASKRQKEAIEADLAGFRNMERLRLQAQNSSQNALAKAQGEALAQASKRQKEAIEADLAGFRNMERLRLQAQNSSQNALAKAQGEALAQASKRQKEAIEADLAGFRNMERLRLQAQSSSQNALAKAQGEALAQASKRQKEAIEADLAGFRNMERLRLQAQSAAQAEQLRSREAHYRKMVAAATNTPEGDFQRYNASSGQAGRLVTVNGLANGPSAGEIATSTRQARDRADELARSLRGVTLEANTLHSASRGLASGFNMLWLTWGEMLPLLTGAAISFGTAFSVKMGAQVDHTLQTIRVLSGETQEAIAGLNDQLLQLASTGPVGPLEVAEAMKTLSLAGMSAGDVSVAIRDVMNFAVAGTTDLKQAADVMTSVATAFNVTATGFNYVGDVIAKTAAVSKASVESVGEAFKTASVIHKQFGVSLEDAGVGIAALANLGIQGTAAGTALRNMYTDLSGRTPKVTKAMNELGLELRDQSGKFKDLVTLTMEFDKGLSRLDGTAQKNALLTILSERGGKPMIELRELVIEEEKVAREFAKRSGQAVVEGFEEGVKNRLQRMRDSIGDSAGFQIMARIELSETPLKQMETAVSALQSSLVSAFSSVKSEASGVALALQDLFRSDSFRSNIESLLQLTLNLAGGLVSLAKFANENAGVLATLTAAYVGLRLAVGHSLELMTFYTKAQTLATTHSWAATAAVTAERVAQGPLAVQKAIATSATQADTMATWANTGAKYAAITASKLFAAALPYVGVVLAVATGAWMLYESVVGSSTKKMEDAAESSAHGKMIGKLNEETARLNENTDAMLANMTVEQLRLSRGQGLDGSKLGKHKELISAEENLAKATARRIRAQETADGTDDRVAVTMLLEGQAKDKLAAEQENARLISKSVRDATTRTVNAANMNAEVTKKLQAARQSAAKTGTDKFLAEQQRQLSGLDRLGKGGTAQQAAQNALDNNLRYNRLDEIAKANKTELDGLRSRLNSEAEALKDFRDANMVQEGEYQSRITSITLEGEKAQRAAAVEGLQAYAAEIGRLLNGLEAMPKSQISDNDKANRREELYAKLLNKAEEFNNDMAKIDEEANKRERRLATDQYKELDKLRKANETAIANSKDRVQAIRDEQEMADKTLGLGGADLEATQARLKIELEAKKELRKFDLESIDKVQARDRLRADAEAAADDETWEAKHRRADDFDAQLRILAKGRADFEVQTQTEVAETVAAVYRKEFRRRTDELATTLSGALVDTLMSAGKEGGRNLRRTLEQELLAKPFRMVVQALIQPFAQQAAAGINNFLGVPGGTAGAAGNLTGAGNLIGAGASLASLGTANAVGAVGGDALGSLIASNATNWGVSSAGVGGLAGAASTIASAVPYVSAFVAVASMIESLDDSGTMHTGGLGSYSRAGGAAYGDTVKSQGLDFNLASKDYKAETAQASVAIATSVANMLDQTANAFGTKAGYYAATAFADDTSSDGARGALMVKLADQTLIDWTGGKDWWLGREFADGEAGAKEYAAAIGKDMRDYLVTQTPDWADSMLMALGDAPSLEGVVETAGKINQAAKMLEAMGRDKLTDTGAAAFEQLQEQFSWWSAEQQAQIAILNAQGKSQEALSRQRELDIALLSEDEKASRRRVFALEDQVTVATEAAGLQKRLNEATMTRTELLALERAQLDPLNQAMFDRVIAAEAAAQASEDAAQASEDAAQASRDRAEAIKTEREGLNRQLLEAVGDTVAIRALELAALDATNRAIQEHIWAIEDTKAAYEKATSAAQAAYNTLERSVTAERASITKTYETEKAAIGARLKAQQEGYQAQIAAAEASADKIRDIAGALSSAVKAVKVDSPATNRAAYDSARAVISRKNIYDPLLKDALDTVSGDTKQFYGKFEDYAFDQAVTAANIRSMDAAAKGQLSAAEALLNSLKASDTLAQTIADAELAALDERHQANLDKLQATLDLGKSQLDALLGIDTSVLSVADAVAALGVAISAAYAAKSAQIAAATAASAQTATGVGGGASGGAASGGAAYVAKEWTDAELTALGFSPADIRATAARAAGAGASSGIDQYVNSIIKDGRDILLNASGFNWTTMTDKTGRIFKDAGEVLSQWTSAQAVAASEAWTNGGINGITSDELAHINSIKDTQAPGQLYSGSGSIDFGNVSTNTGQSYSAQDVAAAVKEVMAYGAQPDAIAQLAATQYGIDRESLQNIAAMYGIPGFAVGINRVPHDMLAQIHEGEAIVPAHYNPYNPGAQAYGNDEVVAELRLLNERLARIEASNAATAGHTAATDRKLARVIKNDAITTEATT